MVLVNCLNMTCQNAARMTMLEKGTCLQWHPLVYSDLPTIIILIAYLASSLEPHAPPIVWRFAEINHYVGLSNAQIQIFHAVTTCGRYQGCLLLTFILHNVMHDITHTLPVGDMPYSKMAAPC